MLEWLSDALQKRGQHIFIVHCIHATDVRERTRENPRETEIEKEPGNAVTSYKYVQSAGGIPIRFSCMD
jgi:hypothetical protein